MKFISLVIVLVALSVCRSSAQMYIATTGPQWTGNYCDNSCPESNPCMLSITGYTQIQGSSCHLVFTRGAVIPSYSFSGSMATITLSSQGEVTLGGDLGIDASRVFLSGLTLYGPNSINIYSSETTIADSSITITDYSQITLRSSIEVFIRNSNFSSNSRTFNFVNLNRLVVDMSGSNLQSVEGVCDASGLPSINIRNSSITGLMFNTAQFKDVLIENTNGLVGTNLNVFPIAPTGAVTFRNSRIWSTGYAWLTPSGSTRMDLLNIFGSHFENVIASANVDVVDIETSTLTVDELYYPIINVTSSSITLMDVILSTRTTTGSAPALTSFETYGAWTISNVVFDSELSVPRMRLGGNRMFLQTGFDFPSLEFITPSIQLGTLGVTRSSFTGDITTTGTTDVTFLNIAVVFNSISVGNGMTIGCGSCDSFRYNITDLDHGIRCLGAADCLNFGNVIIDWPYALPSAGSRFFFSNSTKSEQTFTSETGEYSISSVSLNSGMYFTFQEVACPSQCSPAPNSAHCVSASQCTCSPGYSGSTCEIAPPMEIVTPQMASPQDSPQDSPSSTPSTPAMSNPSQSPDSTPSSLPTSPSPDSPTSSAQQQVPMWCISLILISIVLLWI